MRLLRALPLVGALLGGGAFAQSPQVPVPYFATLSESRLFAGTRYGQALLSRFEAAQMALGSENREIESGLVARERELTRQRSALTPEEFRRRADEFNAEVESYRRIQADKERALYLEHDSDRRRFNQVSNEILTELMRERGIHAIIAEDAILLAFREIDITDALIALMDARIGPDGTALAAPGAEPPAESSAPVAD